MKMTHDKFIEALTNSFEDNRVCTYAVAEALLREPVDAKSARSAKRAAVLQVAAYAYIMKEMGLATPRNVHLWLGGDARWSAPALDLIDLAEHFVDRVKSSISNQISPSEESGSRPNASGSRKS